MTMLPAFVVPPFRRVMPTTAMHAPRALMQIKLWLVDGPRPEQMTRRFGLGRAYYRLQRRHYPVPYQDTLRLTWAQARHGPTSPRVVRRLLLSKPIFFSTLLLRYSTIRNLHGVGSIDTIRGRAM